jgi:hypothetical protein
MLKPQILNIEENDHSKVMFIIEPVLERLGDGTAATGIYKIYRSYVYNQSGLSNQAQPIHYKNEGLRDAENPDYLGSFSVEAIGAWHYQGNRLNDDEQQQLAQCVKEFISS